MARRKKADNPYTELIGVRYTLAQKQYLEEQAGNTPLSTYIRNLSLRRSIPKSVPAINWQSYQELQKMSVALAQLQTAWSSAIAPSKSANKPEFEEGLVLLREVKASLKQITQELIAAYAGEQEDDSEEEAAS